MMIAKKKTRIVKLYFLSQLRFQFSVINQCSSSKLLYEGFCDFSIHVMFANFWAYLLEIFPSLFCSKTILWIVWDAYWKTNKVSGAYLEILYIYVLTGFTPVLRLPRQPPCSLEGNFVAFTSSKVDVSWYLSTMLIDTNYRFAIAYEFCLLWWIMCSLVRLI